MHWTEACLAKRESKTIVNRLYNYGVSAGYLYGSAVRHAVSGWGDEVGFLEDCSAAYGACVFMVGSDESGDGEETPAQAVGARGTEVSFTSIHFGCCSTPEMAAISSADSRSCIGTYMDGANWRKKSALVIASTEA